MANVIEKRPVSLVALIRWVAGLTDQHWLAAVAGWLDAYQELITLDGLAPYYLGSKYPEEADEARDAWRSYIMVKTLFPQANHELNSRWLHAIDEAADVINTHYSMMYYKAVKTHVKAEITRDMLYKSVAIMISCVETQTGRLSLDARFGLCRAALWMAIAKMDICAIRPHSKDCRVDWGTFPTGEDSE